MSKENFFDAEEKNIFDSVENGEWKESEKLPETKTLFLEAYKNTIKQKRSISIRLPEADIHEIKKKSIQTGIPYQNLIQSLVHKFAIGEIKLGL
jgi:predicted DNA binding CopG/RHH family protein